MALFGRKKKTIVGDDQKAPDPISVTNSDLSAVARYLTEFEAGASDEHAVRAAVAKLARAGGGISIEARIRQNATFDRPWRWLLAVAQEAQRAGNLSLTAHIILFVNVWQSTYAPAFGIADFDGVTLEPASSSMRAEFCTLAMYVLPKMNQSEVIVDHPTGRIDVRGLLVLSSIATIELESLVHPDVAAWARRASN